MKLNVGVIDYGMGNLHSVSKALALQGAHVTVTDNRRQLEKSDLLVLPGVGSFGAGMKTLKSKGLDKLVRTWIQEARAYLGICLGFQMLFEGSEESRGVEGLGVLKGKVVRFRPADFKGKDFQIPHMGWNTAVQSFKGACVFDGISKKDRFYFVHSYFPVPKDESLIMTRTEYGKPFCSSIAAPNLLATQFHPEKSGAIGQRLLKNVLDVVMAA